MPTVPRLEGNRIEERGLSITRQPTSAPVEAFGGGKSAAGLTQAGMELAETTRQIAIKEREGADQIAIMDADRKLADLETRLLHDPESGAYNKKGKDAFGLPDTVMEEYQKEVRAIQEGLANDYQKQSFYEISTKRGGFINRAIQKHVSKEAFSYDSQATKSYIENERNAAVENFEDDDRIALSIQRQKGVIIAHADRNGLPDETKKEMLMAAESGTHAGVMTKLMNGGADLMAKEYYSKHKKQMIPADKERMDKLLKKSFILGQGQRNTDKIVAKSPTMSEALEEARKVKDPELRDETVSRVKQRFAEMNAAKRDQEEKDYETAFQYIEDTRNFDAIPKEVLDRIPPTDQRKLKDHLYNLQLGKPTKTKLDVYYNLELMASNPATRDKFLTTNLIKHIPDLSEGDFKKISKWQRDGRKGITKGMDGLTSKNKIIDGSLKEMGIDVSTKAKPAEIKSANLYRQRIDELNMEFYQQHGRDMNTKELRETLKELQYEVVLDKGRIFGFETFGYGDKKKRIYEFTPDETPVLRHENIPTAERVKIENALKRSNKPVTKENVLYYYGKRINQRLQRNVGK